MRPLGIRTRSPSRKGLLLRRSSRPQMLQLGDGLLHGHDRIAVLHNGNQEELPGVRLVHELAERVLSALINLRRTRNQAHEPTTTLVDEAAEVVVLTEPGRRSLVKDDAHDLVDLLVGEDRPELGSMNRPNSSGLVVRGLEIVQSSLRT